jgi:hypothetical protein
MGGMCSGCICVRFDLSFKLSPPLTPAVTTHNKQTDASAGASGPRRLRAAPFASLSVGTRGSSAPAPLFSLAMARHGGSSDFTSGGGSEFGGGGGGDDSDSSSESEDTLSESEIQFMQR